MEQTVFSDSSTSAAQKRVRNAIAYSLKNKYGIENEEVTRKILKIHGMDVDNFDVIANTERSINVGLVDTSVDQNSNKNEKTISGLLNEAITNPYSKILGYRYLYRKMKELYGKSEAKRLAGEMYDFSIALSDSTKILQNYCYAFDFTKLVLEGRPWGQLHSAPPKRLTSYIAALTETVHQLASNIAGAVAVSTFFLDSAHVLIYNEKKSLFKIKTSKKMRKYVQNSYQSFIHSVNHLSRNSIESPFTNVSIFDKNKLEGLIGKDNMGWYFNEIPSWFICIGDRREKWTKYVVDYISELQNIYIEFFDKGDKLAGGKPYRFPVCFSGEQHIIVNGDLVSFADFIKTDGWIDVKDKNLFTKYNGEDVQINAVFSSTSPEMIIIKSANGVGKDLKVSPDHRFPTSRGFVAAKDLIKGDKILCTYQQKGDYKSKIDTSKFINDPWVIGYKLRMNDETRLTAETETIFDGRNHNTSHPLSVIENNRNFIYAKPEEEYIKTKESKQKGSIKRFIDADFDFGFFLGLMYGDGHISENEVGVSFNKTEIESINFVKNYVSKIINNVSIRYRDCGNGAQITWDSKTLSTMLKFIMSSGAEKKYFKPEFIDTLPKETIEGILLGMVASDGSVNNHSVSQTTISAKGVESIQYMANLLGIKTKSYKAKKRTTGFGGERAKEIYVINYGTKDMRSLFNKYYSYHRKFSKLEKNVRIANSSYDFIVNKIILVKEDTRVYNIEVNNEEHVYSLPCGVTTSNCTLNISKNVETGEILDKKFLKYISNKEIFRYNIMVSGSNKFANCCRLISQTDMFDMGGQVSSLGLSAISLGSHRVATINFNRIALESKDIDDYFNILSERADSAAKILKAHKELIIDTEKWGFQPFISNGYIKMEKMFSTFGVLGLVEGARNLSKKTGISENGILEQSLKFLNDRAKELGMEYKITINIEQIPGETVAIKLHDTDALIYGNDVSEAPLYSNQFLELWKDASIWERMDVDGSLNKLYTGGGIVAFNISDKPTASQIKKLIEYSVKSGSEHFSLNAVYSECENSHTSFGNHDVCPKCGGKIIEKYTRVVGFFVPVSSWNKVRREWEFPRRVFKSVE